MNQKERLYRALDLENVDRVPCASPLQTGTLDLMKASGAYWPAANRNAALMAALSKSANSHAKIESMRLPFAISLEVTAFGGEIGKESIDRQPAIIKAPLTGLADFDDVRIPDPYLDGEIPVVIDAIEILASESETVPLICAVVGPFTSAGQLKGSQDLITDVAVRPQHVKQVLEIATQWSINYAKAAIEAGADVISIIDSTAGGDVLGPSQFSEFAYPYQKRLVDAIHKAGARSILHICGKTRKSLSMMVDTNVDGISIDQQMDIGWVSKQVNGKVALIGNVSPTSTLLFKRPEDVMAEAKHCIEGGTNILAPGCGFASETPLENMRALSEAAHRYGAHS